jgi:AmmeMemoRadiSam system protein A
MRTPELRDQGQLADREGRALLWLARRTIARHLGLAGDEDNDREMKAILAAPRLQERRGVFVTLKSAGCLRGCIGCLSAAATIVDGVRDSAVKAAFHDPRFAPLTVEELAAVKIEISVLTPLAPLEYDDGADLIARLRPGRDGVLIGRGGHTATFLPQVWEQLPEAERFLDHLCLKAGLPDSAWREGDLRVETYQVQAFAE